ADEIRALLMLAGPGRLDQSFDHRMDGTIPLANLQHHTRESVGAETYLRDAKKPKRSMFNPVSLPPSTSGLGVAHYSWSGKDSSMRHDAVAIVTAYMHNTPNDLAGLIHFPREGDVDYEALSRALTLDFRNVGTAARETDSVVGSDFAHKVLTTPDKATLTEIPECFGAVRLREILTWPRSEPKLDAEAAKGREIFLNRTVGEVLNQRVVLRREAYSPQEYSGIAVIAPLDRSKSIEAQVPVRCATCHNYSPLSAKRSLTKPIADFQRCDLCHFDHPAKDRPGAFIALSEHMRAEKLDSVEGCLCCHSEHPDFGPQAFSNSWLLPFDANGNGVTGGDEIADGAAGGIGTDAYLNLETLFMIQLRPPDKRPEKMYLVSDNARSVPKEPRFSKQGYGWVRVSPLISTKFTAPYLHNGSVPTLAELLSDPQSRPKQFAVGLSEQGFTLDTGLPGNSNLGHAYGVNLSADEKTALIRFLDSLP
ncbi:MAG TPA: hypothetical protein VGM03_00970, partial [Phycisphaerae bacterium]